MATILIVEDSPSQAQVIQRIVESAGHRSLLAENGEAGIEMAQQHHPDLILMDVIMPNLNGFQATRKLTRDEATKEIPVIILTTKSMESDRAWGMRQGAQAYLTKPFIENDLTRLIDQHLPPKAA